MKAFLRLVVRFIAITLIEAASLWLTALIVPGIQIVQTANANVFTAAVSVAIVLAILNGVVRPLLILITLPINIFTVGIFTLFINAAMLWLTAFFLPFFEINSYWGALFGAFVLAIVNTILTSLTTIDDDYAFYDGVVQWLSRRQPEAEATSQKRGLVILQIDGLSYQRMRRALADGLMPTLNKLLQQETHALSHIDCGLPSQTSACQAGIMYGDNYDIPAFRWFVKEEGRLLVSNNFNDAAEIDRRYMNGQGLLCGGTSINNLISGEAPNTLMTISAMQVASAGSGPRSSQDFYLVFVNPYFFTRALILSLWDMLLELYQGVRQRLRNVQPRVNRLEKAYPLLRGITNVFLRDVSTYTVILNIMRGSPVMYATFLGYDEIAHHAGPDSKDAFNSLKGIDTQLRRILDVIQRKAPRPYDLFVLSDHGQSFGATFKQRYGETLSQLLETLVGQKRRVADVATTESARVQTAALLAEIENLQRTQTTKGLGGRVLNRAAKSLSKRVEPEETAVPMDTDALACVSGNLANVYFSLRPGKVTLPELREAYPSLLSALISHPGIGLVVGYEADGEPWVMGKSGARHLREGLLAEDDPLPPYGDPDLRAAQLLRLADFPHAGDLILISTLYENGQVAAFEELVGNHGGLGGQQTDAFLLHPIDVEVPQISNSADVYHILKSRRALTGPPPQPEPQSRTAVNAWSRHTLWIGFSRGQMLLSRAVRVLRLDRGVFEEIADDPYATGQALLLMLLLALGSGTAGALDTSIAVAPSIKFLVAAMAQLLVWLAVVLLAQLASSVLRGRGNFTRTLRTLAFAQLPGIVGWLLFLPRVGPLLAAVSLIMIFITTWFALQEAFDVGIWRALIIPIFGLLLVGLLFAATLTVVGGVSLTIETLLQQVGWLPAASPNP